MTKDKQDEMQSMKKMTTMEQEAKCLMQWKKKKKKKVQLE